MDKVSIKELLKDEAEALARLKDVRQQLLAEIDATVRPLIVLRHRLQSSEGFTERQTEVFNMVTQGKQDKEIACALNISVRTVKFHVTNLLEKAGVSNRREL